MNDSLMALEQDGVMFYVARHSGEAGLSVLGLARLCGVEPSVARELIRKQFDCEIESLREVLERKFLLADDQENLKVYSAELCVAIVQHYACEGRRDAICNLGKFSRLGFDEWVRQIVGWQRPIEPIATQRKPPRRSPQSIVSPEDLADEVRSLNQREMQAIAEPGTTAHESCQFLARRYRAQEPAEPMSPLNEAIEQSIRRMRPNGHN